QSATREHERAVDRALHETRLPLFVDCLEHRPHLFHHHGGAISRLDPALRGLDHDRAILLDVNVGKGLGQIDESEDLAGKVAQPTGFDGHVRESVRQGREKTCVTLKNRRGESKAIPTYAGHSGAHMTTVASVCRRASWDWVTSCVTR